MRITYAFLVFLSLLFNSNSTAQSLVFTDVLNNAWGAPNYDLTVKAYVVNISNSAIRVKMRSEVIDSADGSQNYFCLNLCYAPGTTVSPDFEQIEPGDTLKTFKGYYRPNGALDAAAIRYTFYNINNLTDSIQLIGHFVPSPASIKPLVESKLQLFPNPADGVLQVNFDLKSYAGSSIIIYNSLGQKIYSEEITNNTGSIKINTANFKEGIYFCSISEGGKLKRTERLMILH
jgi:hypothetical protein